MSQRHKICFLGDTHVGKTTFLAALYHTRSEQLHLEIPFDDELKSGRLLESYAASIRSGSPVASTTGVRRFRGRLVWGRDARVDIEFIDIPGEVFYQGYAQSDGELLEQMRPFINECDYLYYFFDQRMMQAGGELFAPLIRLLQDYYQQRGQRASLSLVLTKLDACPDYSGAAGAERFLHLLQHDYGDELATMRPYADILPCRVSSYGSEGGSLGLSPEAMEELFLPLRELATSHRSSRVWNRVFLWLLSLSLLGGVVHLFAKSEKKMLREQGISLTGWFDNESDIRDYVTQQLKVLERKMINDDTVSQLRESYAALAQKHLASRLRVEERWLQRSSTYRASLETRLADIIAQLRRQPDESKWEEYEKLTDLYRRELAPALPEELIVSYDQIFTKIKIDDILAINYRGNPHAYTHARVQALRAYLHSAPKHLSDREHIELTRALELAVDFLSDRRYEVEIEARGLSSAYDLFYILQIGNDGNAQYTTPSSVYQSSTSARSTRMGFRWNIAHRVKVTLLHKTFFFADDDDELADIWRDSSMSSVALSLFASEAWQQKSHAFDSHARGVEFRFKLWDERGEALKPEDFQLVVQYVLNNEFWQQQREELQ